LFLDRFQDYTHINFKYAWLSQNEALANEYGLTGIAKAMGIEWAKDLKVDLVEPARADEEELTYTLEAVVPQLTDTPSAPVEELTDTPSAPVEELTDIPPEPVTQQTDGKKSREFRVGENGEITYQNLFTEKWEAIPWKLDEAEAQEHPRIKDEKVFSLAAGKHLPTLKGALLIGEQSGKVYVDAGKGTPAHFGNLSKEHLENLTEIAATKQKADGKPEKKAPSEASDKEEPTPEEAADAKGKSSLSEPPKETSNTEQETIEEKKKSFSNTRVGLGAGVLALAGGERDDPEKRQQAEAKGEKFEPKKRWFMRVVAFVASILALDVAVRGDNAILGPFTARVLNKGQPLGNGVFR
jgi:hypothetical protein